MSEIRWSAGYLMGAGRFGFHGMPIGGENLSRRLVLWWLRPRVFPGWRPERDRAAKFRRAADALATLR